MYPYQDAPSSCLLMMFPNAAKVQVGAHFQRPVKMQSCVQSFESHQRNMHRVKAPNTSGARPVPSSKLPNVAAYVSASDKMTSIKFIAAAVLKKNKDAVSVPNHRD